MSKEKNPSNFIEELKRRRVFRVATLYVVAMWPMIQIADILSPALNLPDTAMKTLLMVFIAGFPVVLILTWLFNLTPKGLVKENEVDPDISTDSSSRLIGKNAELAIVGMLLVVAIGLFVFQSNMDQSELALEANIVTSSNSALVIEPYKSIAVLPFVPFSDKKEDGYFADGLSEEILNVLAKINSIRVVARTSSFAFKGVNQNIQTVGKALGVDVILEGSVRRNDVNNTIRITAQLINVKTGSHIWSETYDRNFTDVFKIQDEITEAVVTELKIKLLGGEKEQLLAHESASPDAMVAYSRGRTELAKRTAESVLKAKQYFEKAVRIDKGYATAYASLAEADILAIGYAEQPRKNYTKSAQEAVDKALAIDPQLGLAWAAQGLIYFSTKDKQKQAIEALEKALSLNPNYAMANMWYGSLQKDDAKKIEYHQKAFQLDPRSPVAGFNVANNLINQGKDAEAMKVFGQIVDADPYYPGAYMIAAEISNYNGRIAQSIKQYKKAYELSAEKYIASTIARLYTRLLDTKNARLWYNTASEGASDDFKTDLTWLNASISLAEGNLEQAKLALLAITESEKDSWSDNYHASRANYWLEDYSKTVREFEMGEKKRKTDDIKPFVYANVETYLYASFAYKQLEQMEQSTTLIDMISEHLDSISTSGKRVSSSHWYEKALLQMIDGDQRQALITLQRALDEGWSEPLTLKYEPIFKSLQLDSSFKSLLAGLVTRMNLMREQLANEESLARRWKT